MLRTLAMLRTAACALGLGVAMAACQASEAAPPPIVREPPAPTVPPGTTPTESASSAAATSTAVGAARYSPGWRVTVYYTAVESFHDGPVRAVRGCLVLRCKWGRSALGSYPADFLKVIQTEGSGRITSGPHRGRYLNWSHSVGYWLDDSTRDNKGRPLRAWESAAADRGVLERGQRFGIAQCGTDSGGRRIPAAVCARFTAASWLVTDLFRPGYGGEHHLDVYIGEETGPGFDHSPVYTTLRGAVLRLTQ